MGIQLEASTAHRTDLPGIGPVCRQIYCGDSQLLVPMKRALHVALAALMLCSVVVGAGVGTAAATSPADTHTDIDVDNDGFDIDDSENVVIDDSEDNDAIDLGVNILS